MSEIGLSTQDRHATKRVSVTCGQVVITLLPSTAKPSQPRRLLCEYLDGNTGDSVKLSSCGCGTQLASVWDCAIYGRCAPLARGKALTEVRDCRTCASYRSAADTPR